MSRHLHPDSDSQKETLNGYIHRHRLLKDLIFLFLRLDILD